MNSFFQTFKKSTVGKTIKRIRNSIVLGKWRRVPEGVALLVKDKHGTLLQYQKEFNLSVLIETGTYMGDTLMACKDAFSEIYSIELDSQLQKKAIERFREFPHIHILHGDSGVELSKLLPSISKPILFWLDGHYSTGVTAKGDLNTPVIAELISIFKSTIPRYVILIDDARLFTGRDDYPTVGAVERLVQTYRPGWKFEVGGDIIRITAK